MRTRRSLIPIAGGVIVVAALVYAFLPRPVEVDVVSAARHPIVVTVDEEGRTRVTSATRCRRRSPGIWPASTRSRAHR